MPKSIEYTFTLFVTDGTKLREAKRFVQEFLNIPKRHVDMDRGDHELVVTLQDPTPELIDKIESLEDNPMIEEVIEGDDVDGWQIGWKKHMPLQDDGVNIDFNWNGKLIKMPDAIDKAINEGKLDTNLSLDDRVRVFQFDTGWSDHYRLKRSPAYDTSLSKSFVRGEEDSDGRDNLKRALQTNGHGTNTGFTVIATPNATDGILRDADRKRKKFFKDMNAGLNPYCRFIPLRVSANVFFDLSLNNDAVSSMHKAMQYAVANGAEVVTMSMGGEKKRDEHEQTAKLAYENGVLFVCAAGQITDDLFFSGILKPAEDPRTIAVGGIQTERQSDGQTTRFVPLKNGAEEEIMDISTPAKWVYCAGISKKNKHFHRLGIGTSQATAHCAAAAALWRHYFRDELKAEPYASQKHLIVEAFKWGLNESKFIPDYWKDKKWWLTQNKGILDTKKLLEVGLPEHAWLASV